MSVPEEAVRAGVEGLRETSMAALIRRLTGAEEVARSELERLLAYVVRETEIRPRPRWWRREADRGE